MFRTRGFIFRKTVVCAVMVCFTLHVLLYHKAALVCKTSLLCSYIGIFFFARWAVANFFFFFFFFFLFIFFFNLLPEDEPSVSKYVDYIKITN
jgi:hypothetical protein